MLRLLPTLVLLGALAISAGTSKTCPSCSVLGQCREITCPSTQDSCLFSQMQLENGMLIKNGSCVAPEKCQGHVYALTYTPHFSLWVSTSCCDNNCSRVAQPEQRPDTQPNGVKCPYCSGKDLDSCDTLSVMNCTGSQNVCVTLAGTWDGAGPQILRGCATPEVCDLQVNTTLGPEASGFHLTSPPECNNKAPPPTTPGPHATLTHAKAKVTTCFTCSNSSHCEAFSCPADKNYCLQMEGFLALAEGNHMAWRNGSCVASKDCKSDSLISALTYSNSFGFWINTTCCHGNCQKPTLLAALPVSHTLSKFLCPTCADSYLGLCNSSLYMQCPLGETECVQLDVASEQDSAGRGNIRVRGCGSRDLCGTRTGTEGLWALFGHRLTGQFKCNSTLRAVIVIDSGAAPGLRFALPVLVAALLTVALS
ncbi:uncharacterized protein LOC123822899 isoform X1 [Phyllostomus hastatus]|uniref:uncharacterized protein LOC123822899 isoform X1 n=1 Tax=Phyllostomus hastatus TaxID=9423 RepID=UPI001E685001|nr:uncharacterized protein LOC123822899 isoform X1 [Phyllostomus hastatus]